MSTSVLEHHTYDHIIDWSHIYQSIFEIWFCNNYVLMVYFKHIHGSSSKLFEVLKEVRSTQNMPERGLMLYKYCHIKMFPNLWKHTWYYVWYGYSLWILLFSIQFLLFYFQLVIMPCNPSKWCYLPKLPPYGK